MIESIATFITTLILLVVFRYIWHYFQRTNESDEEQTVTQPLPTTPVKELSTINISTLVKSNDTVKPLQEHFNISKKKPTGINSELLKYIKEQKFEPFSNQYALKSTLHYYAKCYANTPEPEPEVPTVPDPPDPPTPQFPYPLPDPGEKQ